MRTSLVLLFLINLTAHATSLDILRQNCQKDGGSLVNKLKCPSSKVVREGNFCVVNKRVFYNGCTGSSITEYGDIFFPACRAHDYCYHHEPATSGKLKEDCDNEFLENMLSICSQEKWFLSCETYAKSFYTAVSYLGDKSWQCSNTVFDYLDL